LTVAERPASAASPAAADLDQVRRQVQAAGSSFYWAMRFLPRAKSDALFAVYAFCREVDDIADGDGTPPAKVAGLAEWHRRIERLFRGAPDHPITRALAPAVSRYGLLQDDFDAVIAGMEMDARGPIVAPSLAELDLYCDRVAAAVGRLCVRIFGESGAAGVDLANSLGRALQLTNILRDVEEDASLGRLYLPAELLAQAGVTLGSPNDVIAHPAIHSAMGALGVMADSAFSAADGALRRCDRKAVRPAVVMMQVYRRTLARLRRRGWPTGARGGIERVVSRAEKLILALFYGLL
jgi:phytoene synthase